MHPRRRMISPAETGARYDRIAERWRDEVPATYGLAALERALLFAPASGAALDVGCGSQGRFVEALMQRGYATEGVDVSAGMVALARQRHPGAVFHHADICTWVLPTKYAFISAWDSTFHLPLDQQAPVLEKLCAGLVEGGVLLFTCGGGAEGEIAGGFEGETFGYSTLGVEAFVRLLDSCGCWCRHVEYDQWPEKHVCIIGQKRDAVPARAL